MPPSTLFVALDEAAGIEDVAVAFPSVHESRTLSELVESSRRAAGGLAGSGVAPGECVGLLSPNGPEFFEAFFGITRLGAAVCPLPIPAGLRHLDSYLDRLERVTAAANMKRLVVSHRFEQVAGLLGERLSHLELIGTDTVAAGPAVDAASVSGDDLAVIQFTSGSTAAPKGVALTHANVLAGLAAISDGIGYTAADSVGMWLPLFHDMGLFGTLSAIVNARPVTVWSPVDFVKHPDDWLREFLAIGATISPAPNFGYDYLTAAFTDDEAKSLPDMSHWRIAFNGAESIAADSISAFLARFAPAGFQPGAMRCVYGMAEATLAVTFPPTGRAPRFDAVDRAALLDGRVVDCDPDSGDARLVANVGDPVLGMEVRLADPAGRVLAEDRRVGEIQVRGPAVMTGYLHLASPFTDDGWLPTGDLGYLRDGDLYVTGRVKEMITVRGTNFYPNDVEALLRSAPGVYRRRCVALADAEREKMVLIVETPMTDEAERQRLRTDLRGRVQGPLGLTDIEIVLVAPRAIPTTTSGKLQRLAAAELIPRPRS